jgi:VanZ family protein
MNRNVRLIFLLAYALIVGALSLQPGGNSAIGSYDKLAHFLTYAVFAVLAYRLGLARATFVFCALAIVAYSGLLEFGQSFIPGRMMSGLDLIANAAGVVLGSVLCLVFFREPKER